MTHRHWIVCTVGTLLVLTVAGISTADVFERDWKTPGDGLLTYDDVNNREWLDLTEIPVITFPGDCAEEKYQSVVGETLPGGIFEGFVPAIEVDVRELAESAGMDTSTRDLDVNRYASAALIGLIGVTLNEGTNQLSIALAVDELGILAGVSIVYAPRGLGSRPGPPQAGYSVAAAFVEDKTSAWLYRAVPEPASATILVAGLFAACFCQLRR